MRYFALIIMGVCTFFYTETVSSSNEGNQFQLQFGTLLRRRASDGGKAAPRAQFTFIDSAWRGKDEVQFETLIPPSEIDFAIQRRLRVEEERNCDDILLYLPRTSAKQGQGVDLNGYLLAALLATYMGKAMVVLETPAAATNFEAVSWFDCPVDVFKKDAIHAKSKLSKEDFPTGLSRLIQHPPWLSHGCPIPCQTSYDFFKWNDLRKQHIQQVTCQNDNDRQAIVFAVSGEDARQYFERQWREQMLERPSAAAYDWAIRLGAKRYEAQTFAKLQKEEDIWYYVSALIARSGIIRFQPWIARDVKALIKSSGLPLDWPYIAIYVHRGDRLQKESREAVSSMPSKEFEIEEKRPLKVIPFQNYLQPWDSTDCNGKAHLVYIATDDPRRIQEEIDRLPKGSGGDTIVKECQKLNFIFSPVKSIHLLDEDAKNDCFELHRFNIAAIADLMILAKSDTFVGEFNSNFGRLVRIFRTAVNNFPGRRQEGPVLVRNIQVASGTIYPGPQGM